MAESAKHIDLINLMKSLVCKNENIDASFLLTDNPYDRKNCPPTLYGYKPDLYYDFRGLLIIGEAKTKDDLLTEHTKNQIGTYIRLCSKFKGESRLYLAVPWTENILATNIIKNISNNLGVMINYYVVDELKGL